jgi:hypothetical protein
MGWIESLDFSLLNATRKEGINGIKGVVAPLVRAMDGFFVCQIYRVAERCVVVKNVPRAERVRVNSNTTV